MDFLDLGWGWLGGSSVSSFFVIGRISLAVFEELELVVQIMFPVGNVVGGKMHSCGIC